MIQFDRRQVASSASLKLEPDCRLIPGRVKASGSPFNGPERDFVSHLRARRSALERELLAVCNLEPPSVAFSVAVAVSAVPVAAAGVAVRAALALLHLSPGRSSAPAEPLRFRQPPAAQSGVWPAIGAELPARMRPVSPRRARSLPLGHANERLGAINGLLALRRRRPCRGPRRSRHLAAAAGHCGAISHGGSPWARSLSSPPPQP